MLRAIQNFFRDRMAPDQTGKHDQHSLQLATAALLFEMLRADFDEHPEEYAVLERVLQHNFSLSASETRQLAQLADQETADAVSLYQFTSLINQHFSAQDKVRVIEMLWQVAYADGRIDRYEEALVRRLSELLHVAHRDFIQAKHRVQESLQ